jgi:hypothetical protein
MVGYAGTGAPPIPILNGTRQRIIISLLAAVLALVDFNVSLNTTPSAAHGNYSTIVGVGGTRVLLACHGNGPVTVAIISPLSIEPAIDDPVQARLTRSVRLCTVTVNDATSSATSDLTGLLPAMLYAQRAPAPYVIISATSDSALFNGLTAHIPFSERVAGWVFVDTAPAPAGIGIRADGATWSLPIGDRDQTALAILSLFWPPDEV